MQAPTLWELNPGFAFGLMDLADKHDSLSQGASSFDEDYIEDAFLDLEVELREHLADVLNADDVEAFCKAFFLAREKTDFTRDWLGMYGYTS